MRNQDRNNGVREKMTTGSFHSQDVLTAKEELLYLVKNEGLNLVLTEIENEFTEQKYSLDVLLAKFKSFYKTGMSSKEALKMLMKAANELIDKESGQWESRGIMENICLSIIGLLKSMNWKVILIFHEIDYLLIVPSS